MVFWGISILAGQNGVAKRPRDQKTKRPKDRSKLANSCLATHLGRLTRFSVPLDLKSQYRPPPFWLTRWPLYSLNLWKTVLGQYCSAKLGFLGVLCCRPTSKQPDSKSRTVFPFGEVTAATLNFYPFDAAGVDLMRASRD